MEVSEQLEFAMLLVVMGIATHPLLKVNVDGNDYVIEGRKKMVIPKGITTIELLKPGSQRNHKIMENGLGERMLEAIANLVRDGKNFSTPLRHEWHEPHHYWSLWPDDNMAPRSS